MARRRSLRPNFGPVLIVMIGTDQEEVEEICCCYWGAVDFLSTTPEIVWWEIYDPKTGELFDSADQHEQELQELADEPDQREDDEAGADD